MILTWASSIKDTEYNCYLAQIINSPYFFVIIGCSIDYNIAGWNFFMESTCTSFHRVKQWYQTSWSPQYGVAMPTSLAGEFSATPDYYIGCKTCNDASVNYIIYSLSVNEMNSAACIESIAIGDTQPNNSKS